MVEGVTRYVGREAYGIFIARVKRIGIDKIILVVVKAYRNGMTAVYGKLVYVDLQTA